MSNLPFTVSHRSGRAAMSDYIASHRLLFGGVKTIFSTIGRFDDTGHLTTKVGILPETGNPPIVAVISFVFDQNNAGSTMHEDKIPLSFKICSSQSRKKFNPDKLSTENPFLIEYTALGFSDSIIEFRRWMGTIELGMAFVDHVPTIYDPIW